MESGRRQWNGFFPFDKSLVVRKTCILQHTPLLITNGLYQQVKLLSATLVTVNLGFIGTYENLERSVTLQHILFIDEFRVTQHLIHSYFQNILEGYTTSLCMKICDWLTKGNLF